MKKPISMLVAAVLLLSVSSANAVETYVYCAETDGNSWDWLLDSSNDYVKIEGIWSREESSNLVQTHFNAFKVPEAIYNSVSSQCPEGKVAQPGDRNSSYWEVFKVSPNNAEDYFADGRRTLFGSSADYFFRSL
jgi:hypothetical protein